MIKRLLSAFMLVIMIGIFLPPNDASANSDVMLYSVTTKAHHGQPYRLTKGGDFVGNVPSGTIIEVIAIEGDWAKVRYKGTEYYMWASKLHKVDAPNIVVSPWAKAWFSEYDGNYYGIAGQWKNVKEDWTKTITRDDMAQVFVGQIMEEIYGPWSVQFTLPGAFKGADELSFTDSESYNANRLLYWGVVPPGKFNGSSSITYGEFTNLLIKLMAYDRKMNTEGVYPKFTKADIDKFAIGGNTNASAKITKEQAEIIAQKTVTWWEEKSVTMPSKSDQSTTDIKGVTTVGTAIYSIRTFIGEKPNQPNLTINAQGKGELRNNKAQKFIVRYKKSYPNLMLYTIQTMDGKYLALANGTKNNNQLITQNKEFLWAIKSTGSLDYQFTHSIFAPINKNQLLSAAASKLDNGTPVITGFVEYDVPKNARWIFDYAGPITKVSSIPTQ